MIQFEEALDIVRNSALIPVAQSIDFTQSCNRVLAEDVFSDMDMPPFDKSAMDGYACRREDLAENLTVIETIPAGVSPSLSIHKGECSKIMTGSMLPAGADCVIKVEETQITGPQQIRFNSASTYHNICFKGEDIKKGMKVLSAGTLLQPQHIAVLAAVGKVNILVYKQLKTGIISTGDELVEPQYVPGISAIRNSNAWQLKAQSEKAGMITTYYGIARDERLDLLEKITLAENDNDLLLLTGGVSMGDYDHVPGVLKELGYTLLIEKIAVQPGSPTLFGQKQNKRVFGLPGNPVSSFVQFEMLVKVFAWESCGYKYNPLTVHLPLATTYKRKKAERLSLVPVCIRDNKVYPIDYHGSAHINAYTEANGILSVKSGIFTLEEGESGDVRFI